jgi:hypothetical protein
MPHFSPLLREVGFSRDDSAIIPSREAAKECSPQRKLWGKTQK